MVQRPLCKRGKGSLPVLLYILKDRQLGSIDLLNFIMLVLRNILHYSYFCFHVIAEESMSGNSSGFFNSPLWSKGRVDQCIVSCCCKRGSLKLCYSESGPDWQHRHHLRLCHECNVPPHLLNQTVHFNSLLPTKWLLSLTLRGTALVLEEHCIHHSAPLK